MGKKITISRIICVWALICCKSWRCKILIPRIFHVKEVFFVSLFSLFLYFSLTSSGFFSSTLFLSNFFDLLLLSSIPVPSGRFLAAIFCSVELICGRVFHPTEYFAPISSPFITHSPPFNSRLLPILYITTNTQSQARWMIWYRMWKKRHSLLASNICENVPSSIENSPRLSK